MVTQSTSEFIDNMLFNTYTDDDLLRVSDVDFVSKLQSILVHVSIFDKVIKLPELRDSTNIWDFQLQIMDKLFDMKLINVNPEVINLDQFINDSQITCVWELDHLVLFTHIELNFILQNFIRLHDLQPYIVKNEVRNAFASTDVLIKIITFDIRGKERSRLIREFQEFYDSIIHHDNMPNTLYHLTMAPSWLKPINIQFFEQIAIDTDTIYSTLPLILYHLRLSLRCELNIIELVSLRLAVSDMRKTNDVSSLYEEIDFWIKRSLNEMADNQTYITNATFNLQQYLVDHNIKPLDETLDYFVYTYQNEFKNFVLVGHDVSCLVRTATVKLLDIKNNLDIIKNNSNIRYLIDGTGYDQMNFKMFCDLASFPNVALLIMDTNYTWEHNFDADQIQRRIEDFSVTLLGSNTTSNFVEKFISSLKLIPSNIFDYIYLSIEDNIRSYSIFDGLNCVHKIALRHITITNSILEQLKDCSFKAEINFIDCHLENHPANWNLINTDNRIKMVRIDEDDQTWHVLFDYISMQFNTNMREFRFSTIPMRTIQIGHAQLHPYKFILDEINFKIEIVNDDNQFVELYHLKNNITDDDNKLDYDFYQ